VKVIPAMDLLGGRVVRLHKGDYDAVTVYSDDPAAVIEGFLEQGAAWLHLVDLDGARDGRATQAPLLASILRRVGARAKVQVGGGVRSIEQARAYAGAGAHRVILGTAAVETPSFIAEVTRVCPVVVALDAREGKVAVKGWTVTTDALATDLAKTCVAQGAEAILYTDIARDGTGTGPNVEATAALARAVPGVEVIASGGVATLAHLAALAAHPEIASAVVGRALYDRAFTVREAFTAAQGGR
jgi:phosphoribosylformimino-5-aminoimidazole carboxamide ribotide isomerase